jgi:hypothetical protein
VNLSGSGVVGAPQLAWTPAVNALDFGSAVVGAASPVQTLTLTNQGPGGVTFSEFRLSGTNAGDFRVDGSSTCSTAAVLAAGSNCTLVVGDVPQGVGSRIASLAIASNGSSPGTITLTGTGLAPPMPLIAVSADTLNFALPAAGASTAQTLTISNTGSAGLSFTNFAVSSAAFTVSGTGAHPCSTTSSLEPGATCELTVSWSGGEQQGSLTISSDAAQGPQSVALVGQQAAVPGSTRTNYGGGGCTVGNGTDLRDPSLILMALAAAVLAWRRRRLRGAGGLQ